MSTPVCLCLRKGQANCGLSGPNTKRRYAARHDPVELTVIGG